MEKINLRSRLFIKLMGKVEVTLEELQAVEDYFFDGSGIEFSSDEINNIKQDFEYVFKDIKESTKEISFANCSTSIRDYILRYAPTEEIYFEGYEDFYGRLNNANINVSTELQKYIENTSDLTEYKMFKYLKTAQAMGLPLVISMEDISFAQKYISFSDVKVKIRDASEYQQMISVMDNVPQAIIIDEDFARQIVSGKVKLLPGMKVVLDINSIVDVNFEHIKYLAENAGLNSVRVLYGVNRTDEYSLEELKKLKEKIEELLSNISPSLPEIDRFIKVYQILGDKISYAFDNDGEASDRAEAHNLIGGLLEENHTCVCEGYAKILCQVLKGVSIDCRYVSGKALDLNSGHAWNQVKIDNRWYNCDLTWDAPKIHIRRALDFCLQSDSEFIFHSPKSMDVEKCSVSYDKNKLHSLLDYFLPLEFDEKMYSPEDVISLLGKIKEFGLEGIRVSINTGYEDEKTYLSVGNIISHNSVMWSENRIFIDSINEFVEKYMETYNTESVNRHGTASFVRSSEGIELVIVDTLKDELIKEGANLEPLFSTKGYNRVPPQSLINSIRGMESRKYQVASNRAEVEWDNRKKVKVKRENKVGEKNR